jgi:hypothetical protein
MAGLFRALARPHVDDGGARAIICATALASGAREPIYEPARAWIVIELDIGERDAAGVTGFSCATGAGILVLARAILTHGTSRTMDIWYSMPWMWDQGNGCIFRGRPSL